MRRMVTIEEFYTCKEYVKFHIHETKAQECPKAYKNIFIDIPDAQEDEEEDIVI